MALGERDERDAGGRSPASAPAGGSSAPARPGDRPPRSRSATRTPTSRRRRRRRDSRPIRSRAQSGGSMSSPSRALPTPARRASGRTRGERKPAALRLRRACKPASDDVALELGEEVQPSRVTLSALALLHGIGRLVGRDHVPHTNVRVELGVRLSASEHRLPGDGHLLVEMLQRHHPLRFSFPCRFAYTSPAVEDPEAERDATRRR